jgi:N-acetylmuramoyl-L-alanine amidase
MILDVCLPPQTMRTPRRSLTLLLALVAVGTAATVGALAATRGSPGRPVSVTAAAGPDSGARQIDPSAFSPGACVALPPTRGNRHLTVFLDAGHGGIDPGAVGVTESGRSVHEALLTLPVELDAARLLRAQGFRVVVSRTRNTSVVRLTPADVSQGALTLQGAHDDVAARDLCADRAHADLLVGIYFDAGAPGNAGSVTGYDAVRSFAAENLRFARLLQADVLGAMNAHGWDIPDEGVIPDSQLGSALSAQAVAYGHLLLLGPAKRGWLSEPSKMPGALIEPLFITDPFEASIAASAQGQEVIAGGIARAVEQYFALPRHRAR